MRGDQLQQLMPRAVVAGAWIDAINGAMAEFKIDTPLRQAAFLATVAHESGQLLRTEENLNYSSAGLLKTWPHRFTPATAAAYANRPVLIANFVYADRMGNGPESSGDGWRYRGKGLIQLTGKRSHLSAAQAFNVDQMTIGSWLSTIEGATRSAAWFWSTSGCNAYADTRNFDGVCDMINLGHKTGAIGDAIGYAERLAFYEAACKILGA